MHAKISRVAWIRFFFFLTDSKFTYKLEIQDGEADWTENILGWNNSIIFLNDHPALAKSELSTDQCLMCQWSTASC